MSNRTIVILAGLWLLGLAVVVLTVYFVRQNNQFHAEFGSLKAVCQGERAEVATYYSTKPGTHPAMAVRTRSGKLRLDTSFIPSEAVAQSLAETQTVLCVGPVQEVFIESCPYTLTGSRRDIRSVDRYYLAQEVRLVDARTGRVVAQERFTGSSPHKCHETEWFREEQNRIVLMGSEVSSDDIKRWARSRLIIR